MSDKAKAAPDDDEEKFELTPEEATALNDVKPLVINRKRILVLISVFLSLLIGGGIIFANLNKKNVKSSSEEELQASSSSSDFIDSLQARALRNRQNEPAPDNNKEPDKIAEPEKEPLLPQASFNNSRAVDSVRPQPQPPPQPPPPQSNYSSPPSPQGSQSPQTHFKSPLVPAVEGRLFSGQGQYAQPAASNPSARSPAEDYFSAAASAGRSSNPYDRVSDYAAQNGQQDKISFYGSSGNSASAAGSGFFIGENSLWTGTVIPGVLETAINTDLPGGVIARVTQNVFDSQTGRNLLIPQGTLLLARYNSSVSYAQRRVQIVWDAMIRPDGFQIELEGANGVDKSGMSGQAAKYRENWFEYLKAAGIITMFSVANAKMTETAAQYASDASAGNIAESNSAFVNQIGGNMVGRAMNIQPTLTVENGTQVNVMLNRTLYLPPAPSFPASQKYILE